MVGYRYFHKWYLSVLLLEAVSWSAVFFCLEDESYCSDTTFREEMFCLSCLTWVVNLTDSSWAQISRKSWRPNWSNRHDTQLHETFMYYVKPYRLIAARWAIVTVFNSSFFDNIHLPHLQRVEAYNYHLEIFSHTVIIEEKDSITNTHVHTLTCHRRLQWTGS